MSCQGFFTFLLFTITVWAARNLLLFAAGIPARTFFIFILFEMFETEIRRYVESHGLNAFEPKAVLFDMDGVLYDSMPNHARSWHESMAKFGLNIAPDEAYAYEGMRGVETIKLVARRQWGKELSDDEAAKMYEVKADFFRQCPKAQKMNGAEELMRKIKAGGLKIVVVTGSGQKSLLKRLIDDYSGLVTPQLMVTSFDVVHGKPNPEPYLRGLEKAGVKSNEAVVVENAPLGVRAGVAAGIFTIGVNTGPLPDKALADEGASLVFPSMAALGDAWQQIMESRYAVL